MIQNYQERLYKTMKSELEAKVNKALLRLDQLFNIKDSEATPIYPVEEALQELSDAKNKLQALEDYMQGSKPLKQLLND